MSTSWHRSSAGWKMRVKAVPGHCPRSARRCSPNGKRKPKRDKNSRMYSGMPDRYSVELSETAQKVYGRMFEEAHACIEAGNETNSKVTRFRMVDEALDKIIPHDPLARDRALAGPLSGIFR